MFLVIILFFIDASSKWVCNSCDHILNTSEIETKMAKLQFELDSLDESFGGIKVREELFKKVPIQK